MVGPPGAVVPDGAAPLPTPRKMDAGPASAKPVYYEERE
jgi:hypothetical protein